MVLNRILILVALLLGGFVQTQAVGYEQYLFFQKGNNDFPLATGGKAASLVISENDFSGVKRVARELQKDISRVTSVVPTLSNENNLPANPVIIGTIGKSKLIDQLIASGKINPDNLKDKWEAFKIQVVKAPFPGVESALVVAGSDKRGTIYGMYDLSEQMGVSPWNWWADVPVQLNKEIWVKNGTFTRGEPAVKYRGIFINDEAPALSTWVGKKFGGFNSKFYVNVFDLLLRLRANYLWPAMWGKTFNMADTLNPKLADEYGIVMGTSHHEPMLRAQQEWKIDGTGAWNYATNRNVLNKFWDDGIARNRNYESIITVGMRGDGDEPMIEGGDMWSNIKLLEEIISDQRKILAKYFTQGADKVPQIWALYKEVQEYYENGMKVPDDITLLWCDDNWGNIRRVPTAAERQRSGGAGMYYHLDYVGGPRSYKWINTIPTTKIWEQMSKTYDYGADRLWIVNVGDLKPMEYPIEFFMDLAWNPKRWGRNQIQEHGRLWAEREFGSKLANDVAGLIDGYTKINGRRKPELLEPGTYSLVNYNEAEKVVAYGNRLAQKADSIYEILPTEYRDAFYQLVLYPVKATSTVNELYVAVAKNHLYANQGRAAANEWREKAIELFKTDSLLTGKYHQLGNGKWSGMLNQPHIGYKSWNDPKTNIMPELRNVVVGDKAEPGIAIESSTLSWSEPEDKIVLPEFNSYTRESHWIDLFNKGIRSYSYSVKAPKWILLSSKKGDIRGQERLFVSIDWNKVPVSNKIEDKIIIKAGEKTFTIFISATNPEFPKRDSLEGFVEGNGVVSIEAEHYTNKTVGKSVSWEKVPNLGRTLSAMAPFPTNGPSLNPKLEENSLQYKIYFFTPGKHKTAVYISPSLNFVAGQPMRLAVSLDDSEPQILEVKAGAVRGGGNDDQLWSNSVRDNIRKLITSIKVDKPGYHTLKISMVDPIVAVQKIVINTGGEKPSYLGPTESYFRINP